MEQFEAYFQRADLDRDGRISGAEAVAFFRGSNLPQQVLAQIWMHADQNRTGFLGRPAFYNALKLVTVAQSKQELTPDIVKAALYGPASAKIPAPQINLAATPAPQPNSVAAVPSPQTGATALPSSQNFGFKGQAPSSTSVNQQFRLTPSTTGMNQQFGQATLSANMKPQFIHSQGNQSMRPPLSMPTSAVSRPRQSSGSPNITSGGSMVGPALPNSNNDWVGGKTSAVSTGVSPSNKQAAPNPLHQFSAFSSTATEKFKGLVGSGHRSTSDLMFGGDIFSANPSPVQQVSSVLPQLITSLPNSSAIVPVTSASQTSAKSDPFQALQTSFVKPSTGVQAPQRSFLPSTNQQIPTQVTSSLSSSGNPAGVGSSTPEESQISWPKMTRTIIQKYAKVFMEVDTDRDGKITGEQAHNLFLSWRLPREVLKQVWDLSDQDSDSMLSLREFCVALYLMERYRDGRPLPSTLPNSVLLDETLLSLAGPPIAYGSMGWSPTAGFTQQQGLPGPQPMTPAGQGSLMQLTVCQADGSIQFNQQNARSPSVDSSHLPSNGEDNSLDTKRQEATETNEKVENNEKVLLDSKEKLEFYRTKMQDLVLYKSRCDNRLNEITERAMADKAEAELLEKKYQEKYKQVAEIHSKLTVEEASFHEIQERKTELHQAIIKMEQGGSADGILQVRADRIQSDLEELLKALTERCKKHAIQMKSSALIELPLGWTPGILEVAAIWDEDWDKFEDEGFSFNIAVSDNVKSASVQRENSSPTCSISPDSVLNADATSEKPFSTIASVFETESVYSVDESKSPRGSPGRQTTYDSPSQEYSEKHFRKSSDGDAETHRSFDEPTWGNFDNNDDIDSVWGFNAKEPDHGKHEEKYFLGSNDFAASPERTDSPQSESAFQKNSPFTFEDSIPGTPISRAGYSPTRHSIESRDPFFDSFSRYDSFSVHGQSSSPHHSRFDSINSTRDFNHSSNLSFDDSDPFGSSGPFKVSSSGSPKKGSEWSSF